MDTVGSRLRDVRRRRVWSQLQLAAEAGVGHATVERCERGEATPRVENLAAIAKALEIQPAWLAYGVGPMALPGNMTVAAQFHIHTGPGTEGKPGYVIVEPGPWGVGVDGGWRVVDAEPAREVR